MAMRTHYDDDYDLLDALDAYDDSSLAEMMEADFSDMLEADFADWLDER